MAPRTGYCTAADISASISPKRLIELTAEKGTVPSAGADEAAESAANLALVIADIADEMDGYLAPRGILTPVTAGPLLPHLRPRAIAMLKFRLFGRRDLDAKDDPNRVERDSAVRWLERIADKTYALPPGTIMVNAPSGGPSVGGIAYASDEAPFRWSGW